MEQQVIDSTEQEVQTADEPKTPTLKETLEAAVKGEDKLPEPPAEKMEEVQREEETAEQPEETKKNKRFLIHGMQTYSTRLWIVTKRWKVTIQKRHRHYQSIKNAMRR